MSASMEFVQDVIDEGAIEVVVTGVAGVERIDADMVRVTYYASRKNGKTVAVHVVWGRHAFLGSLRMLDHARETIAQEFSKPWNANADESRQGMN